MPENSINDLANRFLDYLAAVHYANAAVIRQTFTDNGGYVAHFGGTCEVGTDILFTAIDEISGIVFLTCRMPTENVNDITLLIVDPSDIQKKYSPKMQYLADVHDGSEDSITKGCWLCEVVGCEVGSNEITPLAQQLWPQDATDFKSDNDQILSLVNRVRQSTGGRGIIVYDRVSDRRRLPVPWTQDHTCRYLVRQRGDRHLLY